MIRRLLFLLLLPAAVPAGPPIVQPLDDVVDREVLRLVPPQAHADTVWFGGSGRGDGTVVRGGVWNFEADSGESPEFFLDGDPVGNQYRDGWRFEDRTARNGPSQVGAGHWRPDGTFDFDFDGGSFAHRATTHANDGVNDGPDPLSESEVFGDWSVWIGTNLELNPEHCGWGRTAGYGDGWSQGIGKAYVIPQGTPAGTRYAVRFFHRYAVEAGADTCWVEVSLDGLHWGQVGGAHTGGDRSNPRPTAQGAAEIADLLTWPGNPEAPGALHVRFRLASDAFVSDATEGGDYFFGWQLDNIRLLRDGAQVDGADFESGMGGWEPLPFEGFDFALTGDPGRPAGRIVPLASLACPPIIECPEACRLEGNVLIFADQDDCDQNDAYADTYLTSPAFAIGGGAHPDLDGDEGRLIRVDLYIDGGSGFFEAGPILCYVYWPFDAQRCPYSPPAGHPGAGTAFNWSQARMTACDFFSQGVGPECYDGFNDNVSNAIPADADSVILHIGAFSQCRSVPTCDPGDQGAPFYDNLRFGVFDPATSDLSARTADRYADNFPTANGSILTATARMDRAVMRLFFDEWDVPFRWVRDDSAIVATSRASTAVFLRFRVIPGPCQPNLNHLFFGAYPPGQWHEARMDTARHPWSQQPEPGIYMTCFHESDPHNGTFWTGTPPTVEPCDDILPDGLFTPGTVVQYFFESRDAMSGAVTGTFPRTPDQRSIGTDEIYRSLWLETGVLPELAPTCDGTYAHNVLVVNDYATNAVPGAGTLMRERLTTILASLGLDFDVYDHVATNYQLSYDGIGRREDRPTQQPRPPYNGATDLMLNRYDCIWYYAGLSESHTLSDRTTLSIFGGQQSIDQQKLETWIGGCSDADPRLLVLEGLGWASDIDVNTTHGPAFLSRFGVDVFADDYAQDLAANDLRRCARVTGTALAPGFDGEVFGSGCPEDFPLDVFGAITSGEAVANFVESLEDGSDPVSCADDVDRAAWHAVIRKRNPSHSCERSVAMSVPFVYLYPLNCADQCLFDDFRINGSSAQLLVDLFQWAGQPINPAPVGVGPPPAAPRLVNVLRPARPNPANPRATIRYAIAEQGRVTLRIFDAGGRLVRTLVDEVRERGEAEATWDGRNDAGRRVGSGVYLYELRAPGYAASRKLVVLP